MNAQSFSGIARKGAIDGALDELAAAIKARRSDIVVRAGAQSGPAVLLFAYRTFQL